ncbi:hypothetical protein [uncultured Duncaniella sp.]|nr:hypothetical protein [uncultured Duncaniella sp.]
MNENKDTHPKKRKEISPGLILIITILLTYSTVMGVAALGVYIFTLLK